MNRKRPIILAILLALTIGVATYAAPPNIILIITDDQGYGDFGLTGNPLIETPHLDAFARESVWMKSFYVSPVCSPTRASLLTGRYNYRTRVVDTYLGRSMMDPGEVTLAELLRNAGYATGIFGKWHLGDCYPMRAMDQGFDESLVLRGGGLAQPADPVGNDRRYTNPILVHNGVLEQSTGYCTDVFFRAATDWLKRAHGDGKPFFAYIATNAPHDPVHDVPEDLRKKYAAKDLSQIIRPAPKAPRKGPDVDALERTAAMITNIDDNIGALLAALDAEGLRDDTLVIFLSDNGPASSRFVGPFRGHKSEVYEGGVRSPFWIRWPGHLKPGTTFDQPVAHIDVVPTLLEAIGRAGLDPPTSIDGRSFWRIATGESAEWPARPLVVQTHRGDTPVARHQFMIRDGDWKLLNASGFGLEKPVSAPKFELYNVATDPGETKNLATENPDQLQRLLAEYDAWFEDVSHTRLDNYAPPRIHVGTAHENPVTLTRQDWRGGTWGKDSIGFWLVDTEPGTYDFEARFTSFGGPIVVELQIGNVAAEASCAAGETCNVLNVALPGGPADFHAVARLGGNPVGIDQIDVKRK